MLNCATRVPSFRHRTDHHKRASSATKVTHFVATWGAACPFANLSDSSLVNNIQKTVSLFFHEHILCHDKNSLFDSVVEKLYYC